MNINNYKLMQKTKGYTLVEIMISFVLLGIVFALGYTFIDRTFVSLDRQKQSLDTLHEARNFLMVIERDLREMTKVVEIDTMFKPSLFDEENALMFKVVFEIPNRTGSGYHNVTYSYEGPEKYQDNPNRQKIIYRQVDGQMKRALISKQLNYLKIWGTDGTIFRNRHVDEGLIEYRNYLTPHYYHPSNPAANGLRELEKIRGIEVQLSMHELFDSSNKPVKQRTFVTRIYPRILNAKFE